MGRRKILLPLAAVIAALGTLMVFLYVQGADERAKEKFDTVDVLTRRKQIDAGESFDDAAKAGKFALKPVPNNALVDGYQTDLTGLSRSRGDPDHLHRRPGHLLDVGATRRSPPRRW